MKSYISHLKSTTCGAELAVVSSVSVWLTFQTPVSNTTLHQWEGET